MLPSPTMRDPDALSRTRFDLVVIGGGLFGACAAWDAAQRGLAVALIERGDFGAATSAHSFKIVHGGIRYIQHGDVYRVRQSSRERAAWLRIAPHLVRPLPIAIPTHGRGVSGKMALGVGLGLYDLLTLDRNRGVSDPTRRVPRSRLLSRNSLRDAFPDLVGDDATGAGMFADAQFYNPPRLVWSVVESAIHAGAVAANHVEATQLVRRGDRIEGVLARDNLTGSEIEIRARVVLNAAGPYAEALLARWHLPLPHPGSYSRDVCFVVPRRLLPGSTALALMTRTRDPDARLSRGARHLFLAPWRDYTLVGTWHRVQPVSSLDISVTDAELRGFVQDANNACPALRLTLEDVSRCHAGLVPFGENPDGAEDLRYGHRSQLVDHAPLHGCENLITLIGVRLTTARFEAERAVDLVFRKSGRRPPRCRTATTPVHGGAFSRWEDLLRDVSRDGALPPSAAHSVAACYGSAYRPALDQKGRSPLATVGSSSTLRAQVYQAVRAEMARTLGDVVQRRTDLATGTYPGRAALGECAEILANELGWTAETVEREIESVESTFPPWERGRRDGSAQAFVASPHPSSRPAKSVS